MSIFSKKKTNTHHVRYKKELNDLKELYDGLIIRLDKLEAKQLTQEEIKQVMQSKMDRLSETIGELRELFKILSNDKKELDVSMSKISDKVEKVEPDKIHKKIEKAIVVVDRCEGKVDLLSKKYKVLSEDLEVYTKKLKVFKGENQLLKLQEKVKDDLKVIEVTANKTHRHASKLENHYVKINEKVNDAVRSSKELKKLKEELLDLKVQIRGDLQSFKDAKDPEALEGRLERLSHLTVDGLSKLKGKIDNAESELGVVMAELKDLDIKDFKSFLSDVSIYLKKPKINDSNSFHELLSKANRSKDEGKLGVFYLRLLDLYEGFSSEDKGKVYDDLLSIYKKLEKFKNKKKKVSKTVSPIRK